VAVADPVVADFSVRGAIGYSTSGSRRLPVVCLETRARPRRRGLITRKDNPNDTRAFALTLTDRGKQVVAQGSAIVGVLERRRLAVLGAPGSKRPAALKEALLLLLEDETDA
jgi:hypothetical protein